MLVRDITFPTPHENILFDDVLLHLADQGAHGEQLRFWEANEHFIVLGRIGKEEDDLKLNAILEDKIPVTRRSSGGGTVVQGKGCLNFSLVLSKERDSTLHDIKKSYQYILNKVIAALNHLGVDAQFFPTSDLALSNQKKFSGNAQRRGKKYILHHGTILYDFDLDCIERYLQMPKDIPEYREGRGHLDFVTNIACDIENVKQEIGRVFECQGSNNELSQDETDYMVTLKSAQDIYVDINP